MYIINAKHCTDARSSLFRRFTPYIITKFLYTLKRDEMQKSVKIALFDDIHANKLRDDMPLPRNGLKKSYLSDTTFLVRVTGIEPARLPARS